MAKRLDLAGLAGWVAELDAWTVYEAEVIRSELAGFGVVVHPAADDASVELFAKGRSATLYLPTAQQVWRRMQNDPRGGSIDPDALESNMRLVMGLSISDAVSKLILGAAPSGAYMGRGFGHQANVRDLLKAASKKPGRIRHAIRRR